ncbi:hypothetical protein [Ktedonosporobacter rubrisoli]|uniref:hypothetical protein n=1 Tax=Ktedonosporobacter rubrisoli TaxID=2509675 RepID=UPI0013EE4409|nr:hypothetical protein [Ktedonosporobacter rubrisoli]
MSNNSHMNKHLLLKLVALCTALLLFSVIGLIATTPASAVNNPSQTTQLDRTPRNTHIGTPDGTQGNTTPGGVTQTVTTEPTQTETQTTSTPTDTIPSPTAKPTRHPTRVPTATPTDTPVVDPTATPAVGVTETPAIVPTPTSRPIPTATPILGVTQPAAIVPTMVASPPPSPTSTGSNTTANAGSPSASNQSDDSGSVSKGKQNSLGMLVPIGGGVSALAILATAIVLLVQLQRKKRAQVAPWAANASAMPAPPVQSNGAWVNQNEWEKQMGLSNNAPPAADYSPMMNNSYATVAVPEMAQSAQMYMQTADPAYGDPNAQAYANSAYIDPNGQAYNDPAYGDPNGQAYMQAAAPNEASYIGSDGQNYMQYADANGQNYMQSADPAYFDPNAQAYGDPNGQAYIDPAYADPNGQAYNDPAYGDPNGQAYIDPAYADPNEQAYIDPNNQEAFFDPAYQPVNEQDYQHVGNQTYETYEMGNGTAEGFEERGGVPQHQGDVTMQYQDSSNPADLLSDPFLEAMIQQAQQGIFVVPNKATTPTASGSVPTPGGEK